MFSGFQEILLIGLIVAGIVILPRMIKPQPPKMTVRRPPRPRLTRSLRLAVVISILWPVCWALTIKPWQQDKILFVVVGLGPVVIGWSIKWILAGMKNKH